jgi:hypothetical protein
MSPLISGKRNSGIHSAHRGRTTGPFGIVFAYKVDRNSLASLETNLREWEAINPPSLWPNAVVVLNEGIIHHVKGLNHCYGNEEIETSNGLISIHYREDTLFHFYSILLQIASPMVLEPLALEKYFEQAEKMGPYVVNGHNRFRNSEDDSVKRLTLPFIEKIVKHCRTQEKITKRELLIRLIGEIPVGSEESDLNSFVYLYNPDNLKGVHEVDKPFEEVNGKLVSSKEIFAPWHIIFVDGECIFFPMSCLRDDDFEKVEGITVADL